MRIVVRDWLVCSSEMLHWSRCGHCTKPYRTFTRLQAFCSARCRLAARYRRKKEDRQ